MCVFVVFNVGCKAVLCHLFEVVFIGFGSYNIENFVEGAIGVDLLVRLHVVFTDLVV